MRKGIIGLICVLCISFAVPITASAGVYVSGKVTGVIQSTKARGYINVEGYKESGKIGSETDGAFGGLVAVGYDFFDTGIPFRVELEYGIYSKTSLKESGSADIFDDGDIASATYKQDFNVQTIFFNAYYDIKTGTAFTPYIGAGVGIALIDTKSKIKASYMGEGGSLGIPSHSNTNFAWNVAVGLGYALTDNITLDAGYRFVGLGKAKTGKISYSDLSFYAKTKDLYMHQFYLGMRVNF